MGTTSSKDQRVEHPKGIPEHSYSEKEFLAKFQRDYDYFSETDAKSSDREPYFCIRDWYFCSASSDETLALPSYNDMRLTNDTLLKGWVYPNSSSPLEPVFVTIDNLSSIVIDRTREYRGYWAMREENSGAPPIYWLQRPNMERYHDAHSLDNYRGALGILSNLVDFVFDRSDGASFCVLKAAEVARKLPLAFDMDLLMEHKTFVREFLVKSRQQLTKSCVFMKSLNALKPSANRRLSPQDWLSKIELAERRSNQLPWGEPLGELSLSDYDDDMVGSDLDESVDAAYDKDDDTSATSIEIVPISKSTKRPSPPTDSLNEANPKRQRAAKQTVTSYYLSSSDDELHALSEIDDDDVCMEGVAEAAKPKQSAKRIAKTKVAPKSAKKKPFVKSDDGDDFEFVDDEDDDDLEMDEESSESEHEIRRGKKADTKDKTKTKTALSADIEPKNVPHYKDLSWDEIAATKEFLDPCGMEATDDIIDRLVGKQIDKIAGLLDRALARDGNLGSISCPLALGTACSGTDAPALALALVKEQLQLRKKADSFAFSHEFSCEVEPFKQAYLARNFDSVLYPDITKMVDDDPRDVYGQVRPVPAMNLFIAGTSCKNFSMLRNKRLDIEDKGCSGETFMAAVEILFKEKPAMTIFENVLNAPWEKMSDYITGRVRLSEIDKRKNISDVKAKDKGAKLTFICVKGSIVVDKVPGTYGVRCGAKVKGFLRGGSSSLCNVEWPSKCEQNCTLDDILKANGISKANDTLVFATECTFCTRFVKMDTKKYGLPQTRERTYMFVWRPKDDDITDDLGDYWTKIVQHLASPAKHSITAFMLEDDHPDVRRYREALNGPPGRQSRRERFQEADFFASTRGDLKYNLGTRKAYGIARNARFLTNWRAYGQKQVPPKLWLPWLNCQSNRVIDFIDILYASSVRDAESHDPLYSSFSWNVSQNAGREAHRQATPGIASCLTPGGDFFVPHRGRPLLGCERLLAQGIPYFRLLLGNETNVQLGDLAGNAMSLTVVCATMLAAITCNQLRNETHAGKQIADVILKDCAENWSAMNSMFMTAEKSSLSCSLPFLRNLVDLAENAVQSSILCICETSGNIADAFVQCQVCRVSCCRRCISDHAGPNLSSHSLFDLDVAQGNHDPASFQEKLRTIAPASVCLTEENLKDIVRVENDIYRVATLAGVVFNLHRIKRDHRRWIIFYYARDNHGVGEAVAEIRITVGELKTQSVALTGVKNIDIGAMAELTSYNPALTEPYVFGKMDPCAMLTLLKSETADSAGWLVREQDVAARVIVEGEGVTDSLRAEVGLADEVAKELKCTAAKSHNKKHYVNARDRGEERRWIYADNWKQWPETILIKAPSGHMQAKQMVVAGKYIRAKCRQTTNQSALWIRRSNSSDSDLYLIIIPNVHRTGPDQLVISSSINYTDSASVVAIFPRDWQPCDALNGQTEIALKLCTWKLSPAVGLLAVKSNIRVMSPVDSDVLVRVTGLSEVQKTMLLRGDAASSESQTIELQVHGGQQAQQIIRIFNSTCVPPILRLAAKSGLKYSIDAEAPFLNILDAEDFGFSSDVVPYRPTEDWIVNDERDRMERTCQPGAARDYVLQLEKACKPFKFVLDRRSGNFDVQCYPKVAAHHAAAHLLRGRHVEGNVQVAFKLSNAFQQIDPPSNPFIVHNCDKEPSTEVPLQGLHSLYPRQERVVSKLIAIENGETSYEEVELSEFEMPGSTGFSLMAKASRTSHICGGVVADAIGAGKTVVSIALILKGIEKARLSMQAPRMSAATLVVVPPGLIDQWESEVAKFAESLTVVKIYDFQTLKNTSLGAILKADIVISPVDILESVGYFKSLVFKSNPQWGERRVPSLPNKSGQLEQTAASGIWIPHTSQDPYAGGNDANSQRRRDDSAYYTHIYSKAILELRKKIYEIDDTGVPLEYFEWERVIVDEVHESLCTTKVEMKARTEATKATPPAAEDKSDGTKKQTKKAKDVASDMDFKERNRRAGREQLGITTKDIKERPLVFRRSMLGLTGTPLLDSAHRVTELASLMGGTYVTGLSSHWRKLEKESGRDIFLSSYLEPKQSREVRKMIDERCQAYLDVACCRNKAEEHMDGIKLIERRRAVKMSEQEKVLYLASQSGIEESKRSLGVSPADFDDLNRETDIGKWLNQNAVMESRGEELVSLCKEILDKDPLTKIIVFAAADIGAVTAAAQSLLDGHSPIGCTYMLHSDSVQDVNRKISHYQRADATDEDRARPRVLVLSFENAAGLNLQSESYNVVLFHPLYSGPGDNSEVADVSVELQAIGRVFRNGQTKPNVYIHRIEMLGPNGEECLDSQLLRRNTDQKTIAAATNASD
ncbi:hypothetical protein MPSEU_000106300 [Mayamaea pseudoterrestris]|nr:hypothetical protein MPSEU_000106300 [Mayamaea pseudoterrestris]